MRNQRLFGPSLAILGAVALFVISLMTWYEVDLSKISVGAKFAAQYAKQADLAISANAWEPWGYGSDIVMLAVILGSIALGIALIGGGGQGGRPGRGAARARRDRHAAGAAAHPQRPAAK